MKKKERILINGVYSNAVGHVIEAFMLANAVRNSNSTAEIHVVINGNAPMELADCVERLEIICLPMDERDFVAGLNIPHIESRLSGDWDYALSVHCGSTISWPTTGLRNFHRAFYDWTESKGIAHWVRRPFRMNRHAEGRKFPSLASSSLKFTIPEHHRNRARSFLSGSGAPRIMILPGSATPEKSPPLSFWSVFVKEMHAKYGNPAVIFVGRFGTDHGATTNFSPQDMKTFIARWPGVRNAFDLSLLEQLAVAEQCDVLVSPHSGMAFALQCVGLPWLALSGWRYHEYLTNGVPLISILPQCPRYPCTDRTILRQCQNAIEQKVDPVVCLQHSALCEKMPDIVRSCQSLIAKSISYKDCIAEHRLKLAETAGGAKGIWENV